MLPILTGNSTACGSATWNWTDPADADLLYVQLWINEVFEHNETPGVETYTKIGLANGTYNLSTRTVDTTGNWDTDWTNATEVNVTECAAPTTGTGGASGSVTPNEGSLWMFSVMLMTSVGLMLYGFADNKNRVYGNIIALFISSLLAVYLSIVAFAPIFSYNTILVSVSQWSTSSPVYTYAETYLEDASLGWMLLIIGVVGMIYAMLMIYEVYGDYKRSTEDSE